MPSKTLIEAMFKQKYKRKPGLDDKKLVEAITFKCQKFMLFEHINKVIMQELKRKFLKEVLTPDVISLFLKNNRRNIKEDLKSDMAFLEAADYVQKSTEKNKYEIAYKKYKKKGISNSFKFFKSAVSNKDYLNFLKSRIKNMSTNSISNRDKDMLFKQHLPDFVCRTLSLNDESIKKHIELAEKHKCNYKELLLVKWYIEQGNKMGVKVYNPRYGGSLQDIMMPYFLKGLY